MNRRAIAWLVAPLAAALSFSTSAAVTLQGTRIIHDAGKGRDVTVKATNVSTSPALTQVWIDAGDSHARPEDVRTPFRLTPAEPRLLQAQQSQAYRITYAPRPSDTALPSGRESVFYFNLLDVPPKPVGSDGTNLLQFAVRTRVKLFHRPAGLPGRPDDAAAQLQWRLQGRALHAYNPTVYHVTLGKVTLADGRTLDADMVAPGAVLQLPLPAGGLPAAILSFQWLDDYGTARDAQATIVH